MNIFIYRHVYIYLHTDLGRAINPRRQDGHWNFMNIDWGDVRFWIVESRPTIRDRVRIRTHQIIRSTQPKALVGTQACGSSSFASTSAPYMVAMF